MSVPRCAMTPMVEADRDGRLDARDKGSLARHLATCGECRRLRADLDRLATLAARPALPEASPLEHQRRRAALLQRAVTMGDPQRVPQTPPGFAGRWEGRFAFALAAAAVLVFGAGVAVRATRAAGPTVEVARRLPPRPQVLASVFETTIRPEAGARYTRTRNGPEERIDLEEGAVELQVRHLAPGERFLVVTADAEVEVRGTAFRVEAHGRRIAGVSVHEGKVEVRYAGYTVGGAAGHDAEEHPPPAPREARPTVVLAKGEAWVAMHDAPVAKRETSNPPSPSSAAAVAAVPAKVAAATPTSSVTAATTAGTGGGGSVTPSPAGTAFTEGMHLIERGDYAAGAEKLDSYRRANAGDPRAEDAAYLTILALQRAGRREDARLAARRYLSEYPNGYRRAEAERVAR